MAIARQERGLGTFKGPVIVMAAESKEDMDCVVSKALDGLNMDVRTRSGITHDVADLKRIAADRAGSIIWLDPDSGDEVSRQQLSESLRKNLVFHKKSNVLDTWCISLSAVIG